MANPAPVYSDKLTKKHWDKKKSVLAKAAGQTGVGDAAQKAEAAYNKIDWGPFLTLGLPTASNDAALKQAEAIKSGMIAKWKSGIQPTVTALKALSSTSEAASAKLAKNKLLKADAALATQIAKDADFLALSLALNGTFFTNIALECDRNIKGIKDSMAVKKAVATETKKFLTTLVKNLTTVKALPIVTPEKWLDLVTQQGRSVSNNLKSNPELAKVHLKHWVQTFKGFDWGTLGFGGIADATKRKEAVDKFIVDVLKASVSLNNDLA